MLAALSKVIETVRRIALPAGIAVGVIMMAMHVWSTYGTYTGLTTRPATAQALVTDITPGRNRRLVALYSFVTPEGVRASGHFSLPGDAASSAYAGQTISVVYDRANPSRNALSVESAWLSLRNGTVLALLLCPALLMLGYYVLVAPQRPQALPAAQ